VEIDRLKTSSREMYERENRFVSAYFVTFCYIIIFVLVSGCSLVYLATLLVPSTKSFKAGSGCAWIDDHLETRKSSCYVTCHPDVLSLAIPSWIGVNLAIKTGTLTNTSHDALAKCLVLQYKLLVSGCELRAKEMEICTNLLISWLRKH